MRKLKSTIYSKKKKKKKRKKERKETGENDMEEANLKNSPRMQRKRSDMRAVR